MGLLTQVYHIILVETTNDGQKQIKKIKNPFGSWCADPFLLKNGDVYYIFAECANLFTNKGCIKYTRIGDKKNKWRPAIKEKFHMSFPNIYKNNNDYYMIPETCAKKEIRKYRCLEFPDKWVLDSILLKDNFFVDSIVLNNYLITYNNKGLDFFEIVDGKLVEKAFIYDANNTLRPAGNPFISNNQFIVPFQNNTKYYGGGLLFKKIEINDKINVQLSFEFSVANARILFKNKNIYGTHTYNKSGKYEVYDVIIKQFSLLSLFGRFLRKIFRKSSF